MKGNPALNRAGAHEQKLAETAQAPAAVKPQAAEPPNSHGS